MPIVGGLDIHRKQLTFDYLDTATGEVKRGQIAPADRAHLRAWLVRFAGRDDVAFAVEGCTGWRYVAEELTGAGVAAHVAEPADTAFARGRKRHAKTGKTDSRHLRELLAGGPAAGVLDPAVAHPGVPGAAGDLSRSAGRAHRLGVLQRCITDNWDVLRVPPGQWLIVIPGPRDRCGGTLRAGVSLSACGGVELGHELAVGGAGCGEVFVAFGDLES